MAGESARTIDEWVDLIGGQVLELRLRSRRTQADVARSANISVSALHALEHGAGSSLATLVAVLRVLDRVDWLSTLAPPVMVSPIAMLRERQRASESKPRRAPRQPRAEASDPGISSAST